MTETLQVLNLTQWRAGNIDLGLILNVMRSLAVRNVVVLGLKGQGPPIKQLNLNRELTINVTFPNLKHNALWSS